MPEVDIAPYEDWMKPHVAKMFSMQYNVDEQEFATLMDNFYDHPYQKDKCIRVVAREKDIVIGFQSFFYWPYTLDGRTFNSYQSGNSLVHPDHRGKGIFQKLLNYLDTHKERLGIDFLMGFPVEESKNSFIRNKWNNLLDLKWHVKIVNPFSILYSSIDQKLSKQFPDNNRLVEERTGTLRLSKDKAFREWRRSYSPHSKYYYFTFTEGDASVSFEMKYVTRKKYLSELVIGDIQVSPENESLFPKALIMLRKKAWKAGITFISVAINESSSTGIFDLIRNAGFRPANKSIYFIIKPFINEDRLLDPSSWTLYRSDIDTW